MIDNKGRLFGKINLLDLVVLIAIVAVAGRFGLKYVQNRAAAPAAAPVTMKVTMKLGSVSAPTMKFLEPGSDLYESKTRAYLGKVVEVRSQPAVVVTRGEDGLTTERTSKDTFDYFVTYEGPAVVSPTNITMGGYEIKIGRTNYLASREWTGYGVTWDMDPKPAAK